jgi:hypothetical protein
MKRLLLFAAAALGLASATATTNVSAPGTELTAQSADSTGIQVQKQDGPPAVTKASARTVDVKVEPRHLLEAPRYIPRYGSRRVKYGKSRWIVLS